MILSTMLTKKAALFPTLQTELAKLTIFRFTPVFGRLDAVNGVIGVHITGD